MPNRIPASNVLYVDLDDVLAKISSAKVNRVDQDDRGNAGVEAASDALTVRQYQGFVDRATADAYAALPTQVITVMHHLAGNCHDATTCPMCQTHTEGIIQGQMFEQQRRSIIDGHRRMAAANHAG